MESRISSFRLAARSTVGVSDRLGAAVSLVSEIYPIAGVGQFAAKGRNLENGTPEGDKQNT